MGAATLLAALASQPASRWYAMLLAAAATLGLNPRSAEDPGWQLSFAAVAGLLLLAPSLRAWLRRRGLPSAVAELLAVCVAAAAATAPLIAQHFGRLSWVTIPANLLAAPAVAPVMWLGAGAALLGQVATGLAAPLTTLAAWPLAFIAAVGHTPARLPGAQARMHVSAAACAAWWALLAALAVRPIRARITRPFRRRRIRVAAVAAAATLAAASALALG